MILTLHRRHCVILLMALSQFCDVCMFKGGVCICENGFLCATLCSCNGGSFMLKCICVDSGGFIVQI